MGKLILVTGASSGFGQLLVPLLLERGHTVMAGLRGGAPRLPEVLGESWRKYPERLIGVDLHLDRPESFEQVKALLKDRGWSGLDVLVNNAGYGVMGPLEELSPEQLRSQFETNYFGPMLLTRALLPELRSRRGRVLAVSSICGMVSYPFYGAYCASKFALDAHMQSLRYELAPLGVEVCLVNPGAFKTSFNSKSVQYAHRPDAFDSPYAQRSRRFKEWQQGGKRHGGDPAKVARLLARLCDAPRMPMRAVVGKDALLMAILQKWLPEAWTRFFITRLFKGAVFKD